MEISAINWLCEKAFSSRTPLFYNDFCRTSKTALWSKKSIKHCCIVVQFIVSLYLLLTKLPNNFSSSESTQNRISLLSIIKLIFACPFSWLARGEHNNLSRYLRAKQFYNSKSYVPLYNNGQNVSIGLKVITSSYF